MKKIIIKALLSTVFIASLGLASTSVMAGRDFFQEQLVQKLQVAKQKLQKAADAKGSEQGALIKEHSTLLQDNMATCREMKPKAGMTEQERDEWFVEHQKIMDEMISQMMQKEALISSLASCSNRK